MIEAALQAIQGAIPISDAEMQTPSTTAKPASEASQLLAAAFAQALPDLERLERYERRAWSRRKFALRQIDSSNYSDASA